MAEITPECGLDSQGFVGHPVCLSKVSAAFLPVLNETIARLSSDFASQIHSIYLHGSVGRGEAQWGVSDLDLSLITHQPLSGEHSAALNTVADDICRQHPSISKLEFDLGTYDEAMVQNAFEWQFWLKHLCTCVWGEDLRPQIAPYRPSLQIGLTMNQDLQQRLCQALEQIKSGFSSAVGKSVAKKILRTHYALYCERDQSFYHDLNAIAAVLLRYDPAFKSAIAQAVRLAQGEASDCAAVQEMIQGYGQPIADRLRVLQDVSNHESRKC
ncbi:nucleotidyltransferase domain-containing protein [Photobacterium sp. GJ3]|uniref:nucleotidyltransferase domain-containing protein n=1 Tax=Photobacterium sp. GJ3 TaxID=2829502 RepID=UPI001B8C6ED6|nr:nucleotidyltransferase domain-containing protein [Photobacterium sp. GJ3]QUJ66504.1 nucleotidyltransferase domain-containing protein [Photobacterium sp. GJ3]